MFVLVHSKTTKNTILYKHINACKSTNMVGYSILISYRKNTKSSIMRSKNRRYKTVPMIRVSIPF